MANSTKKQALASEGKQVGRFGIIGVLNTVIDFGFFNLLIKFANFSPIPANIVSTTIALTFSFIANKSYVFRVKGRSNLKQAAIFLAVTAFSIYAIQNGILYLFTEIWPYSFEFWYKLLEPLVGKIMSLEFAINNGAKAIAVGVGMVWNYLWYKKIVFRR